MTEAHDALHPGPGALTHVIYNAALGHVRVRAEDGPATTVEVPSGEVRFRRVRGAVEPEAALWVDGAERDYLGRMLDHVLGALKITSEARTALESLRDKLTELGPPAILATEGGPSAGAAASDGALLEPVVVVAEGEPVAPPARDE